MVGFLGPLGLGSLGWGWTLGWGGVGDPGKLASNSHVSLLGSGSSGSLGLLGGLLGLLGVYFLGLLWLASWGAWDWATWGGVGQLGVGLGTMERWAWVLTWG